MFARRIVWRPILMGWSSVPTGWGPIPVLYCIQISRSSRRSSRASGPCTRAAWQPRHWRAAWPREQEPGGGSHGEQRR